jgi:hypothetical protein
MRIYYPLDIRELFKRTPRDYVVLEKLLISSNIHHHVLLWLGHKYVVKLGKFKRWWYKDSVNSDIFIENAKKYVKIEEFTPSSLTDYIFGDNAKIVIPALCEMGIFERVITELLEKAKLLLLAERQKIADMISKPEVTDALHFITESDDKYGNRIIMDYLPTKEVEGFFTKRQDFCETVSSEFCEKKMKEARATLGKSNWYDLGNKIKAFEKEADLYLEDQYKVFERIGGSVPIERCFERLLSEPNLSTYASQTVADFLWSNTNQVDFATFLVKLWNKSQQRKSLIEICIIFSNKKKGMFRWYAEPFLSEKIRLGDCDEFLSDENLATHSVFGPRVADRVLDLLEKESPLN